MVEINSIINEYISIEDLSDNGNNEARKVNISEINFELLRREFEKVRKKKLLFRDLEEVIQQKLDAMISENPSRMDYYERYRSIIESYNGEQDSVAIQKIFDELTRLAKDLDDEQKRHIREGFTNEEELSIYDILVKPELSKDDIVKVKSVSIELLQKIKEIIAGSDHWSEKLETRASVDIVIRDTLWDELPECYDNSNIDDCRDRISRYIYERFGRAA